MKKTFLICLAVLFVFGCGFSPLYIDNTDESSWKFSGSNSIQTEMSQIKVEYISERFGQQIRNVLLDALTPKGVPQKPKYRLYVEQVSKDTFQQALRKDITATRERVRYKVKYRLLDSNGNDLLDGNSIAYVSYDILSNPYSTTMARKKTEANAAEIIANDIVLRLGAYFHTKYNK